METPPPAESNPARVELAAGGLVWKRFGVREKLAIIHRVKHGDWSLPKGKLESNETPEEAALREVQEEIGIEARLGAPAGCVSYVKSGFPKVVLFWHMKITRERPLLNADEVDEIRWVTPSEAMRLLSHRQERQLIARESQRRGLIRRWL